ncbi:MAG TPA: tryptophan synthase subunit alpha, partial [Desulfobacterales bacterium]|nr:tryptophan synthase subunit alpha [Desulfobacterales bacterium]
PLADGPVIAAAATETSARGFGLAEAIGLAAEFRVAAGGDGPPVALMTYLNPLVRMGLGRAATAIREAGVAGVIVPDMPPEASGPWRSVAEGIDTVFLVAPTSTATRLAAVGAASEGFVYCVTTTGVTGERSELPEGIGEHVARMREHTSLPVAAGFGISSPSQAAAVARVADGVVVGTAIVRRQAEPQALEEFVASLAEAVRTARG